MSFTNAQLAQKIADLIEYWSDFNKEYSDWQGGAVGGGPGNDGRYPLTDWFGNELLVRSPAQLEDDVDDLVTGAQGYANAAAASAAAALTSENNAATSEATALSHANDADADRVAAGISETNATNAAVTATTQANLAATRAAAALVSETNAATSETNAAASEAAAAASAAAAATFDPALFMKLDGTQAMTGTLQGVAATFSGAVTGSNLAVSNWNTAYGWGDHAAAGYLTSFTETDPTVGSHIKAITAGQITNWDTAYGWGNHSTQNYAVTTGDTFTGTMSFGAMPIIKNAGGASQISFDREAAADKWRIGASGDATDDFIIYDTVAASSRLKIDDSTGDVTLAAALSVTGAVTGSNLNVSNWDTAYGWGNHASAGYAPTASPTFTGTTNMSTLNAGNIDSSGTVTASSYFKVDAASGNGFGFWNGPPWTYGILMSSATDGTYGGRITGETTSDYNMYFHMDSGTNRGYYFENNDAPMFGIHPTGLIADLPQFTLTQKGGEGDVRLIIEADSDNLGAETDQAELWLAQDGRGVLGYFRTVDNNNLEIGSSQTTVGTYTTPVMQWAYNSNFVTFPGPVDVGRLEKQNDYLNVRCGSGNVTGFRMQNPDTGVNYGYFYADANGIGILHDGGGWSVQVGDTTHEITLHDAVTLGSTLNGYSLSTPASAPPGASQIVKTHTNGYTYLGWLNTTSGSTTTDPTRIYCSYDSFVRYMTPTAFIDFLEGETWAWTGDVRFTSKLRTYYGISGGYGQGPATSNFGATIWAIGDSYTGGTSGTNSSVTSLYGLKWLRSGHTNYRSDVGEGVYLYQNGTLYSAMGTGGHLVGSSGDITKVSHGNYLYHQSTAYDNNQNGGITFSTSAASGGTTGDIWFQYS